MSMPAADSASWRGWGLLWLALLPAAGAWLLDTQLQAIQQQQDRVMQQSQQLKTRRATIHAHHQRLLAYQRWYPWLEKTVMMPLPDTDVWDSRLFSTQQQYQLPEAHYRLQSVRACADLRWPLPACTVFSSLQPQASLAAAPLWMTGLQLTVVARHESALLAWLDALQQRYPSAFILRRCEWSLTVDANEIKASCFLDWFHLARMLPENTGGK